MLKKVITIIMTALLIISLAGCQGNKTADNNQPSTTPEATPGATATPTPEPTKELSSVEKIKQAGKIVVGTESTFPPFEGVDPKDGKTVVGFDMDIAAAIAQKLGVKLEIKDMKFDSLVTAVKTGMIDFTAAGMNPTPERDKEVDFSKVYFKTKQVLVVKDDSSIKSAADLNGKKLGAQLGTTSEEAANSIQGASVKTMDKVSDLMLEIKSGRLDGVVVENVVAGNHIKAGGLKLVDMSELNKDGEAGIAIAVKDGDKELLDIVNGVLSELESSGEYDKLLEKWGMTK